MLTFEEKIKKAAHHIKTNNARDKYGKWHNPSEAWFYILEFRDNTIMNLTKHRGKWGTWYSSDTVGRTFSGMREVKEWCARLILMGQFGQTWKEDLESRIA